MPSTACEPRRGWLLCFQNVLATWSAAAAAGHACPCLLAPQRSKPIAVAPALPMLQIRLVGGGKAYNELMLITADNGVHWGLAHPAWWLPKD